MQPFLAAPRDDLTKEKVLGLITNSETSYTPGLELLSDTNEFQDDISGDLAKGSTIEWDNRNAIRATYRINLLRELAWGRQRVRPYMTLSLGDLSARFNLGVCILTRPSEKRGEDVITYDATGNDLIARLDQTGPANTWVMEADGVGTYFEAAQAVMDASGIGAVLHLQPDARDTVITETKVWALMDPAPSWLRILTDILSLIGYVAPWPDPDGNFQSGPFVDPAVRPSEFTFDPDAPDTIVYGERTVDTETGDEFNDWLFISANASITPTIGNGLIYKPPPNQSSGPNSIDALGVTKTRVKYLQVADADELIAEGDKIRAADIASVRSISLTIEPLPLLWANDVVTYTDRGATEKALVMSWKLSLDGRPDRIQIGGAPAVPTQPVSTQAKATVTANDPQMRVVVDGATVDSFANALDEAIYDIGDRVTVTIRNPVPPLVQGRET